MRADSQTEAQVAAVFATLFDALERRDIDAMVSTFAPDRDAFLQGTGQDESCTGIPAIRAQFERDRAQSDAFSASILRLVISAAGPVAWTAGDVLGRATVGDVTIEIPMRMTAVLERRASGWLFVQIHLSIASASQSAGDSFPSAIEAVAEAVEREAIDLQSRMAPDGTVTLLFTDIEASTPLAEQLGDRRWVELLREHTSLVREQIARHGGFEVKTIGDAFMVAFRSARAALHCAIGVQQAISQQEAAHPGPPLRVRIGLHAGEPVREGNDFHGTSVVLASRIATEAGGGEILVSSLLRDLVGGTGEFRFDDGREVELKGLAGRHRVYAVDAGT